MCQNCNNESGPARVELQNTFGAIVGMESAVPVAPYNANQPVLAECDECGVETDSYTTNDSGTYCESCESEKFTECNDCNKSIERDDSHSDPDGNDLCESCYNDNYCVCDKCSETIANDDSHSVEDRRFSTVCQGCYDEYFCSCQDCNNDIRRDSAYTYGDDYLCESCYCDNYGGCEGCGETYHNDDLNYSERRGCSYCNDCRPGSSGSDGDDFDAKRFAPSSNTFQRTGSRRKFGVELETSSCDGYDALEGEVYFGACEDGSIDGKEFVSAVLDGDKGLAAIDDFCGRAEELGFEVDNKCGFHAHFDVSDLSDDQLRAVACAYNLTYKVWSAFVSDARNKNHYCGANDWDCDDVSYQRDFKAWAKGRDRYQWLNLASYAKHSTFEVRLHSATLNPVKITNWVIANVRFIDYVKDMTVAEVRAAFEGHSASYVFSILAEVWGDTLAAYFRERAAKFGKRWEATSTASRSALESSAV